MRRDPSRLPIATLSTEAIAERASKGQLERQNHLIGTKERVPGAWAGTGRFTQTYLFAARFPAALASASVMYLPFLVLPNSRSVER